MSNDLRAAPVLQVQVASEDPFQGELTQESESGEDPEEETVNKVGDSQVS